MQITLFFLNFAQSIEYFSIQYRDNEARSAARNDGWRGKGTPLRYRFEDVLLSLNIYLVLSDDEIKLLAKTLSDFRNFFTHYSENRVEPSYQEMSAAGRVLHFALLALVYQIVGLGEDSVRKSIRYFSHGSLFRDIRVVLKQEDIRHDYLF